MFRYSLMTLFILITCGTLFSQTGITVSPPRLYYEINANESRSELLTVTNVSADHALDLAISFGDWHYDKEGNNILLPADSLENSCAAWITVSQNNSYFSLKPGEKKEIEVTLSVPADLDNSIPVHTGMIYVTQMNPIDDINSKGANIKLNIRSGVKVYFKPTNNINKIVEITNLVYNKDNKTIDLTFVNSGNSWSDGIIYTSLLNTENGQKNEIDKIVFYSLPGDERNVRITLPEDIEIGKKYVATILVDFGNESILEMAELNFTYE